MTWLEEAEKYTTSPVALVEVDFSVTDTRKYSVDFIRPTNSAKYKGNILNLPRIYQSIGDIKRSFEMSRIEIIFSDNDQEFRQLVQSQAIKNKGVRIKMAFPNRSLATEAYTVFTGWVYDYVIVDDFHFKLICENIFPNLDNEYPEKRVETTDYPNADESAIGWIIPIPYGTVSGLGLSGRGAFGHPSLSNSGFGGMLLVDNTLDAEISLVGLQTGAITVSRVYIDGELKTEGAGNDYTIGTQVIDGFTYTEIRWKADVNPTRFNKVGADVTFGARTPVEMIRHFLENFCEYDVVTFNAATYAVATNTESERGYLADGSLWESGRTLRYLLDSWRDEFELDIYMDKDGEIVFKYITAILGTVNSYSDVLDIHPGFDMEAKVDELLNSLKYGYNYNYSGTYFYSYAEYEDTDSQTKYGQTYFKFKGFEWIRIAAMARDIAARKILRFKDTITFYTLKLPLRSYAQDLADVIKVTHYQGAGSTGFTDKLCQIRASELYIDAFNNMVQLEDVTNFMGQGCILGDELILPAKWTNATTEQQDYCYLCDEVTEQFSDGKSGKRMFD